MAVLGAGFLHCLAESILLFGIRISWNMVAGRDHIPSGTVNNWLMHDKEKEAMNCYPCPSRNHTEATPEFETNTQFPSVSLQLDPLGLTGTDACTSKAKSLHKCICLEQMHSHCSPSTFLFSSSNQYCTWELLTTVVTRAGKAQRNQRIHLW